MQHAEGFLNLVRDAKKRVKEESFRETKKRLDSGEKFLLVDTREDAQLNLRIIRRKELAARRGHKRGADFPAKFRAHGNVLQIWIG